MKNQYWFRKGAGVRICFFAVVVNAKLRQFPNQSDQIETTPVIPFTNLDLGNVASTPLNSGAHACNVELRCIEANIPNPNLNSRLQRSLLQSEARARVRMEIARHPRAKPSIVAPCLKQPGSSMANAVELRRIHKTFDHFTAVDHLSLNLRAGS